MNGDITTVPADAIVNAANNAFAHGGGVDGAIRRAAGPELSGEMRRRYPSGTPTGTAVWTEAYSLPARWVIHAVGPVWGQGGQNKLDHLASAYSNALRVADELGAKTVNAPAIGILERAFESGRSATDLTDNQRRRWHDLREHNRHDCTGMRSVCMIAAGEIAHAEARNVERPAQLTGLA